MQNKNALGFKVCYKEQGKTQYVRHFLTQTYRQAICAISRYIRYPPTARADGHKLIKPKWKIIPVKGIEADIWNEPPF